MGIKLLFPQRTTESQALDYVEHLIGDRDSKRSALSDDAKSWDVTIAIDLIKLMSSP